MKILDPQLDRAEKIQIGISHFLRLTLIIAAGALLASVVGYVYLKKGSSGIVNRILRSFFCRQSSIYPEAVIGGRHGPA